MDIYTASRHLNVAVADVVSVEETSAGPLVELRDGGKRLIRDDGHFAVDDHPATAHLRRFEFEPDEVDEPEDEPEPKPRAPRGRKSAK